MKLTVNHISIMLGVGIAIFSLGCIGMRIGRMGGGPYDDPYHCVRNDGLPCTEQDRVDMGLKPHKTLRPIFVYSFYTMATGVLIMVPAFLVRKSIQRVQQALDYEKLITQPDVSNPPYREPGGGNCPHCGARYSDRQVYCFKCGKEVKVS